MDLRRAGTIGACSTTARSTATACCCVDEVGMFRIHGPTPRRAWVRGQKWVSKHCGRRQTLRAPSRYLTENIFENCSGRGGQTRAVEAAASLIPAFLGLSTAREDRGRRPKMPFIRIRQRCWASSTRCSRLVRYLGSVRCALASQLKSDRRRSRRLLELSLASLDRMPR